MRKHVSILISILLLLHIPSYANLVLSSDSPNKKKTKYNTKTKPTPTTQQDLAKPDEPLEELQANNPMSQRNYTAYPSGNNLVEFYFQNKKYLLRPSCEEADKYARQLKTWVESRKENCEIQSAQKNEIYEDERFSNWCAVEVSQCLPEHLKKYYGKSFPEAGPNCYNAALVISDIVPAFRYTSPTEMQAFMDSPLCKKIAANSKPQPGDIGLVLSQDLETKKEEYAHAFIYISDEMVYSKNGVDATSSYLLNTKNYMDKVYRINDTFCPNDELKDDNTSRKCKNHQEYYHCSSMTEFLDKEKPEKQLLNLWQKTEDFENCWGTRIESQSSPVSIENQKNLVDTIKALAEYSSTHAESLKQNASDQKVYELLKIKLFSIWKTIALIAHSSYSRGEVLLSKAMQSELQKIDPKMMKDFIEARD